MDRKDHLISALVQQRNAAQDMVAHAMAEANVKLAELEAKIAELKAKKDAE